MAGLPAGVMGVYISINTLCDMGATCVNVIGDMAGCVVLQEKIDLRVIGQNVLIETAFSP